MHMCIYFKCSLFSNCTYNICQLELSAADRCTYHRPPVTRPRIVVVGRSYTFLLDGNAAIAQTGIL